jgi:hypothetical protein
MPQSGGGVQFYFDPATGTVYPNTTVEENAALNDCTTCVRATVACDMRRGNVSAVYSKKYPGTLVFAVSDGLAYEPIAEAGVDCSDTASLQVWAIGQYPTRSNPAP